MKYIRTEDGIVDLSKVTIDEGGWKNIEEYIAFKQEDQKDQIQYADTIEELCDGFIAMPLYDSDCGIKKGKHYFVCKEEIEKFIPSVKIKATELFGAIWTDKGLIYVAKMNDKGELELL